MMIRKRPWLLWLLLLIVAIALLLWALKDVPFQAIGRVLAGLSVSQLALLLFVNTGIVFLLGLRWWLILRAQGYDLSYLAITRYRLAAFGLSYFTPGPHFGGEPLQVIYLRQRHGIPGSSALAATALDKMIELFGNFAFLSIGIAVVVGSGRFTGFVAAETQFVPLFLLLLPILYLLSLWLGWRPVSVLASRLPERWAQAARDTEEQLSQLSREKPTLFATGLAASIIVWLALLFEYWLALRFLGLSLGITDLLAVVVAARLAMFAPTPGALGALEAGQVLAMQALGYDPAIGLSLSLLIRGRDILFGGLGLWLGSDLRPLRG